jgi:hypothetical protein
MVIRLTDSKHPATERLPALSIDFSALQSRLKRSLIGDFAHDAYMRLRLLRARRRGMRAHLVREFEAVFGHAPDLDNPRTFNEKMQFLKMQSRTPLHRICADKIAVRDYVADRLGTDLLVPLLHVFDDASAVTPQTISEDRFVVKATHDSGSTQICTDRETFNWRSARRRLSGALARDYAYLHYELQYHDIPRKIIVEELLDGAATSDYKIFCFDGEPFMTGVNYDRRGTHRHDFFDLEWNRLPVVYAKPTIGHAIPVPLTYDRMIDYARTLSKGFPFCRIDYFESEGQLFFNEITFHQYSGLMRFDPDEFDRILGDRITLPAHL